MIAIAKGLRRIADHLHPEGSAEHAVKSVLRLPVRNILALKRDAKAAANNLSLPNFTGK